MFVHTKEERDKHHAKAVDQRTITVEFSGKPKSTVKINTFYVMDLKSFMKRFFTTPLSRISQLKITYTVNRIMIEPVIGEDITNEENTD